MSDYNLGTARGKIIVESDGRGIDQINGQLSSIDSRQRQGAEAAQTLGLGLLSVGGAALAGFGLAVNSAADFESQLSAIQAVSQGTEAQMEAVRKKALELGADTKFSAGEAAGAIEELSRRGIELDDILNGAADATVNLAAATDTDLATAATIASNAMNVFGLEAKNLDDIVNKIAGFDVVGSSVEDFGLAMNQAAAVADLAGVSFDDLTTAIALMSQAGVNSSDAGTSLKTFFNNLQPQTKKQIELARELGILTEDGNNLFYDQAGNLKSLSDVSEILYQSTKDLTAQQRQQALETLFGSDAIRAAAIIAEGGGASFDELATKIGSVDAGEQAAIRMDNLSGSIEQLKGSVETYLIGAGTPFLDSIRGIVDGLTTLVNWFGELPAPVQKIIGQFVLFAGIAFVVAGGLAYFLGTFIKFAQAVSAFKGLFSIAKGAGQASKAMGALNATFLANPIFLVIAAIIAIGVALFILYKKSERFRNFVNGLWDSLKEAWESVKSFFEQIPEFFQKVFDKITGIIDGFRDFWNSLWSGFSEDEGSPAERVAIRIHDAFESLVNFFKSIPGEIADFFSGLYGAIAGALGAAWGAVVDFVKSLPGAIANGLKQAFIAYIDFYKKLPARAAYFLGRVIGMWLRFYINLGKLILKIGSKVLGAVVDFMTALPGVTIRFLKRVVAAWVDFQTTIINTVIDIATSIVSFMIEKLTEFVTWLPGFLLGIITQFIAWGVDLVAWAWETWNGFVDAAIDTLVSLPGKVLGFLIQIITALPGKAAEFFSGAFNIGKNFIDGLLGGIGDLIGLVKTMVTNAINGVGDLGQSAYNKMKEIGSSMWNGFKDGLGIHSPSFVEKAVFAMNDNVKASIVTLAKQVGQIQRLGSNLPGMATATSTATSPASMAALGVGGSSSTIQSSAAPSHTWNQNAPLIGQATIRRDEDIVDLAKKLDELQQRRMKGRGTPRGTTS